MAYSNEQLQSAGINPDRLTVIEHPLVEHYMTIVRDEQTSDKDFGSLVTRTLAPILAYEATRRVASVPKTVRTPTGVDYKGSSVKDRALVVTIPRAGDAFKQAFFDLLPGADYGYVTARRDEETGKAQFSEVKLAPDCNHSSIFILDPMKATGGSMVGTAQMLLDRGARPENITTVSLVSSFAGVAAVHSLSSEIQVVTCGLDPDLDYRQFIIPGLGDAGNRLYGEATSGVATRG